LFERQLIPKQYRIPRPASVDDRQQHPFWELVPFESVAALAAFFVAGLGLFGGTDDTLRVATLHAIAKDAPTRSAIVLSLGSNATPSGCRDTVERYVDLGKARGALFLPLGEKLCPASNVERAHRVPLLDLPDGALRFAPDGGVMGFETTAPSSWLTRLGGPVDARWVATGEDRGMPVVSLDDLVAGRVAPGVLEGRVAVVTLDDPLGSEATKSAEGVGESVARALGAALDGGARRGLSNWITAVFALVSASAIATSHRRRGLFLGTLIAAASTVLFVLSLFELASSGYLLSPGSFAAGLVACALTLALPQFVSKRRAVARATELIERAALIHTQAAHNIPDAEFWARIAGMASQAHPADELIVAELPPHKWHLKFWETGNMSESAIGERRRDIRRTPYCNDEGVPMIRVVRNYLVMKDVPVLVVPLMTLGEIEGYVFLCGTRAERGFAEAPDLAARMAKDLALLIRRRRLGSLHEKDWRRTAGALVPHPSQRAAALIEGARVALDDLALFASIVREAPVGLLYADSFGDVRLLGRAFAEWLPKFGVSSPSTTSNGLLSPGSLPLRVVLDGLTRNADEQVTLSAISANPEGLAFRVRTHDENVATELSFSIRALFQHSDGVTSPSGYVASLVVTGAVREVEPGNVKRLGPAEPDDAITVFSLPELVAGVVATASRRSGRAVRFEPPRSLAKVAGRARPFGAALEEFLADAASRSAGQHGPVVTITERRNSVELNVLDLELGLPSATLKRAVAAPTEPPEGLRSLARLVLAIEDSLGRASLRSEDGWGVTFSATLVVARPRVNVPADGSAVVVDLLKWSERG